MKFAYLFLIFGIFLALGCLSNNGQDNSYDYNGVNVSKSSILQECLNKTDCDMFSCMVPSCWCKSGQLSNGIIFKSGKTVTDRNGAKKTVSDYLSLNSIPFIQVRNAIKLNEIFYNVFYEDANGDVYGLIVAVDGTIMETECGV
ncbi:MAG: hypothetical protein WCT31_05455 [Candidatus Micrarchaeia archaeon]|jgi:hypothetical protein